VKGSDLGRRLREGDRSAAPAALNVIEDRSVEGRKQAAALLAELGDEPRAHLIGVTGPPGAGKSSLLSALVPVWRGQSRSVAVLAVDPSSRRSGGSLLGDRVRIGQDPKDDAVLIRSTAAGTRLGGLAEPTREAAFALAAAYASVGGETASASPRPTSRSFARRWPSSCNRARATRSSF
jgi:LAO/AO transport system kinase